MACLLTLTWFASGLYKNLTVKTVVIPSGDKPSVVADAPEDYAKDTSPDKVSTPGVIMPIYCR